MNVVVEADISDTSLSCLLDQVEAVGEVVILRHGLAVAKLVPIEPPRKTRELGSFDHLLPSDLNGLDHDKHADPDWQAMIERMEGNGGP